MTTIRLIARAMTSLTLLQVVLILLGLVVAHDYTTTHRLSKPRPLTGNCTVCGAEHVEVVCIECCSMAR
jgi:hypothetical protein